MRGAADRGGFGRPQAAQLRERGQRVEHLVPLAQRLLGLQLQAKQAQVARIARGKIVEHGERLVVSLLRHEKVGERREARLVQRLGAALGLVEELLALAEAAELVGAARGDDRRDTLRLLAAEGQRGTFLGRGVAPLEERDERLVQRLAQPHVLAFRAIGAHARRDRHQRRHEPGERVERQVAAQHEEDEEVQRKLDAVRLRDDHDVAGRILREQRDRHRDGGEDDRPDREAHG